MSDRIKSADLCERCAYSFERFCRAQGRRGGCPKCEMMDGKTCKCLTVDFNTPCPYFEEAQDEKTE